MGGEVKDRNFGGNWGDQFTAQEVEAIEIERLKCPACKSALTDNTAFYLCQSGNCLKAWTPIPLSQPIRWMEVPIAKPPCQTQACGHCETLHLYSVESEYNFCELCEARSELRDALEMEASFKAKLKEAKELIRCFHGDPAWEIYDSSSPEMKRLNAAIAKATGAEGNAMTLDLSAWNPRYVQYCRANGFTLGACPDKSNAEFIIWSNQQILAARKEHPEFFIGQSLVNHDGYDAWLVARVDELLRFTETADTLPSPVSGGGPVCSSPAERAELLSPKSGKRAEGTRP